MAILRMTLAGSTDRASVEHYFEGVIIGKWEWGQTWWGKPRVVIRTNGKETINKIIDTVHGAFNTYLIDKGRYQWGRASFLFPTNYFVLRHRYRFHW